MFLLYILFGAYLLAVNVYAFMLVKNQKKIYEQRGEHSPDKNSKLLIAGFLGGAIAAYAALFILKFKTDNVLLMILLPVLSVLNIYLIILLFRNSFFIPV